MSAINDKLKKKMYTEYNDCFEIATLSAECRNND